MDLKEFKKISKEFGIVSIVDRRRGDIDMRSAYLSLHERKYYQINIKSKHYQTTIFYQPHKDLRACSYMSVYRIRISSNN